jgi:hypothetical protein
VHPRTRRTAQALGAAAAATIVSGVVEGTTGTSTETVSALLVLTCLGLFVALVVLLVGDAARALRARRLPGRPGAGDPAVAAALAARARRHESRALAQRDPLLARDLRIGRPDLGTAYDDGGLVDLNSAPPEVIARVCGIDLAAAAGIVATRCAVGWFGAVDDVFALGNVPLPLWDRIRDRAVVITG